MILIFLRINTILKIFYVTTITFIRIRWFELEAGLHSLLLEALINQQNFRFNKQSLIKQIF